jgi:hypothetical protein
MILEKIIALYEAKAAERKTTGWPSGSRFGACAAQLQMQQFPETFPTEALRPRALMTFEEGDRVEEWWTQAIEAVYPGRSGLPQSVFHVAVPLDAADVDRLLARGFRQARPREETTLTGEAYLAQGPAARDHRIWGEVREGFRPSAVREMDGRVKYRLAADRTTGFVLDPSARVLYAPTYVDRIIRHPEAGLVVIEAKSMSIAGFRRALLGDLGYRIRCQLAGFVSATGLPVCVLIHEKNAAHKLQLHYADKDERVRVQMTRLNGQSEVYFVDKGAVTSEAGQATDLLGDAEWERAAMWTPYEPTLVGAIQERIRRVLLFDGDPAKLYRETFFSFTCANCDGTGTQTLTRAERVPLKKAKPCDECGGTGQLDEVELGAMPCGYCQLALPSCWAKAGVRRELDTRPHLYIPRAAFAASGLTFVSPEGPLTAGPPAADQPPADAGMSPAPATSQEPIAGSSQKASPAEDQPLQPAEASTPTDGRVRADKQAGDGRRAASAAVVVDTPASEQRDDPDEGRSEPADSGSTPAAMAPPGQPKFLDW